MTIRSSGDIIANINAHITTNGVQQITGAILSGDMVDMAESVMHRQMYTTTTSGNIVLDLHKNVLNLTLNGHVSNVTTINRDANLASTSKVKIYAGTADRNLTFSSSWQWIGASPTGIPANRYGLLTLTNFGNNETDVLSAYEIIGSGI